MKKLYLSVLIAITVSFLVKGQSINPTLLRGTILHEGELNSTYFNVPHIGRMESSSLDQRTLSYGHLDNSYLYFSSLIIGAKVTNMINGEKFALTVPSAYRTSKSGGKKFTLLPIEGSTNSTSNTIPRASDASTWPESWGGIWNGFFGVGETRSTEELTFISSDINMTEYSETGSYLPFKDNSELGGLGLEVKTHAFAWSPSQEDAFRQMENVQVVVHRISNISDYDIDSLFVGNWVADLIRWNTSDDQKELDTLNSTLLMYDNSGAGVVAIKVLDNPSLEPIIMNEFDAGALQLNADESVYEIMTINNDNDTSSDTDLTLSTRPFTLQKDSSAIIAYAYTIVEEGHTVEENKAIIKSKLDYVYESYKSGFTLDRLSDIQLSNGERNININLDMSSADTLMNLNQAIVNAVIVSKGDTTIHRLVSNNENLNYTGDILANRNQPVEILFQVSGVGLPGSGFSRGRIEVEKVESNNPNMHKFEIEPIKYFRNIESSGFLVPTNYIIEFGNKGYGSSTGIDMFLDGTVRFLPSKAVNFKILDHISREEVEFAFFEAHPGLNTSFCNSEAGLEQGYFTAAGNGKCSDIVYILSDLEGNGTKIPIEQLTLSPTSNPNLSLNPSYGDTVKVVKRLDKIIVNVGYTPEYIESIFVTPSEGQNITNRDTESEITNAIKLHQNYPNPFNPTTQISYSLPEAKMVRLEISNILGQSVATLVNERKSAGNYTVNFDAAGLSSGVYFYTIQAGAFTQTNKMLLIK